MHARRRRLDRVSSPRPPSARQAPKLNKGSPLPRQRPAVCSRATTTSLAQPAWTTYDDDHDDNNNDNQLSRQTITQDHHLFQDDEHDRDRSTSPHPDSLRCPLVLSSHPRWIARIVDTKKPPISPSHRLARPRVTRRLHHPPSGSFRSLTSSPRPWTPSPCSDCWVATCKPHFPGLGLGNALRLTQPVRRRPTPFGPSCISSRHLDRIGSLVSFAHPAFVDITRPSSRPLGVCSSTKLDCIQDVGILTFTALPPWSRPCGLASDRALLLTRLR